MPDRRAARRRLTARRRGLAVLCGLALVPVFLGAVGLSRGVGFLTLGRAQAAAPGSPAKGARPGSSRPGTAADLAARAVGSPAPPGPPHRGRHRRHHPPAPPPAPGAAMSPGPGPRPGSPPSGQELTAASQVLALINQARAQAGLAPYAISGGLDASASAHNARMAGGCGLSHQCPGEPPLGTRETDAGVVWMSAGENIGEGGPVSATSSAIAQMAVALTQDMLNEKPPDDGHRLNILSSSFHRIGIAVTIDGSGTVWMTQDFSN